jgi:molybdate transport system regulatory protein
MQAMSRSRRSEAITLDGDVWMTVGGQSLGGQGRIGLLGAIEKTGSITHAAKAVGMSYKAAWDAVDTMNNLAGAPLVERSAGGRGGGSTRLTERGRQLVQRYLQVHEMHRRFVEQLSASSADLSRDIDLLRAFNMKTSARNQFVGKVSKLVGGAVNDEVEITLRGGQKVVAIVTHESVETLGLTLGATAFALVKASSVIVATELGSGRLSARNQLVGKVLRVTPGAVNAEVVIDLANPAAGDDALTIAAIVTQPSALALGLQPGAEAAAIFKASSVIVGVPA